MAGAIIPLFSKRTFNFTGLQASTTMEVVLLKELDVSVYREGMVLLRVHSATLDHASSLMDLEVKSTLPSIEDPSQDFVGTSSIVTVRVASTTSAPVLLTGDLGSDFGAFVELVLQATRGASGSITADLSADLVLKE